MLRYCATSFGAGKPSAHLPLPALFRSFASAAPARGKKPIQGASVFVSNLRWDVGQSTLADWMKQFGTVVDARIFISGKQSLGYGVVRFSSAEEADRAIFQGNETVLSGRPVFIRRNLETRYLPPAEGEINPRIVTPDLAAVLLQSESPAIMVRNFNGPDELADIIEKFVAEGVRVDSHCQLSSSFALLGLPHFYPTDLQRVRDIAASALKHSPSGQQLQLFFLRHPSFGEVPAASDE